MEKVYIVDENDEIVGSKPRDLLNANDICRVTGLWIENSKGEVLLAQRKLNKKHDPGKWGPAVAGTVTEDEAYEDNVRKEALEELGLRKIDLKLGPKLRMSTSHNYFAQWFIAKLDKDISEFIIQEDEVEQIKWVNKKDLISDFKKNRNNYIASAEVWLHALVCAERSK